jgi:hypothetical protein
MSIIKNIFRKGLLKEHLINEVKSKNCGTHYTKQYMFESDFDPFSHLDTDTDGDHIIEDPIDESEDCVLGFSNGNTKLEWPYFSLPAGYTCPFATVCKTFASKPNQKFKDGSSLKQGKEAEFRCYAARAQAQYPAAKNKVFRNLDLIVDAGKSGGVKGMADLIVKSIKHHGLEHSKVFRIHESGDFFTEDYFKAWILVANQLSNIRFYAYTTSIKFWLSNEASVPNNLKLIASMDKNNSELILNNDLRYSVVVYSPEQAAELGLKIDIDDSLAWGTDDNFALLIHGSQPSGSEASKAVRDIKKSGVKDKMGQMYKQNRASKLKKLQDL